MSKITELMRKNPMGVWLIIDLLLILIVYLILYHSPTSMYTNDPQRMIMNAFIGFIFSKFAMHSLFNFIVPPKCILESDIRTCRF